MTCKQKSKLTSINFLFDITDHGHSHGFDEEFKTLDGQFMSFEYKIFQVNCEVKFTIDDLPVKQLYVSYDDCIEHDGYEIWQSLLYTFDDIEYKKNDQMHFSHASYPTRSIERLIITEIMEKYNLDKQCKPLRTTHGSIKTNYHREEKTLFF